MKYEVTNGQRPIDILAMLAGGHVKAYWVTVPEGKWASEIEQMLAERLPDAENIGTQILDPAQWRDKVKFPIQGETLEGYLFPDTYQFSRGMSAHEIIREMLDNFQAKCYAAYLANPPDGRRSLYQVLTLASLVEAEAKKPEERAIIAGVYMNRLRLQDAAAMRRHGDLCL